MPYTPPFSIGEQLDGSPYAAGNCVAGTDAWIVARSTQGAVLTTSAHIRDLTNDTSGGLTYDQVRAVNAAYYNLNTVQDRTATWAQISTEVARGGFGVCGSYKSLSGTKYDSFRGAFKGNHSVYVNEQFDDGDYFVGDPGADGRYAGCPQGWQRWPDKVLRAFAAGFVQGDGTTIGKDAAYVLYTVPDPVVPVRWRVGFHPVPPATRTAFFRYHVVGGKVTTAPGYPHGRKLYSTGGFSGPCTPPTRYPWPDQNRVVELVKITDGSYDKWFVSSKTAREVS